MNVIRVLDANDIETILKKIDYRQAAFGEDLRWSIGVVLLNYGDGYVNVRCVGGEWAGTKSELTPRDGIPLCPNGHPLLETSLTPRLALIEEDNVNI